MKYPVNSICRSIPTHQPNRQMIIWHMKLIIFSWHNCHYNISFTLLWHSYVYIPNYIYIYTILYIDSNMVIHFMVIMCVHIMILMMIIIIITILITYELCVERAVKNSILISILWARLLCLWQMLCTYHKNINLNIYMCVCVCHHYYRLTMHIV